MASARDSHPLDPAKLLVLKARAWLDSMDMTCYAHRAKAGFFRLLPVKPLWPV